MDEDSEQAFQTIYDLSNDLFPTFEDHAEFVVFGE